MEWTVDTCVLVKCVDTSDQDCIDCSTFLGMISREGKLCLDPEGDIAKEYSRYIKSNPWLKKWWIKINGRVGCIHWASSKLHNKYTEKLEQLHFDDDDFKFVGVASRTDDKTIVSGWDSDYSPEICCYLGENIGIRLLTPSEALEA